MIENPTLLQYLLAQSDQLAQQTLVHLALTGLSLLIALVIGVPTGILIARYRGWASPVLGLVGVLQTIPSIALLGFMIPLMGIGFQPAIIALFVYALLPIVRNTYTGLQEVEPSVIEAARGMGMTPWQILTKVELPLALPTLFAGIRTATVINVGVATLAAYIGAGGLGAFIFGGISLNNQNMILAGAIPAALLAILLDAALGKLQRLPARRIQRVSVVLLVALPLLTGAYYGPQAFDTRLVGGFPPEFMGRPDGYPALKKVYGLDLPTRTVMSALMYKAVAVGSVDLIAGYATDGRIEAYDLVALEDDRKLFPPYFCAPLVRGNLLEAHPNLRGVLELLAGRLPDSTMTRLNYLVDGRKRSPESVARQFLASAGLLKPRPGAQPIGAPSQTITLGSKTFTEQYLLAEMYAQLLRAHTDFSVSVKAGLGGTKLCFDALANDDIDLYPEYTGTGLLVLLQADQQTQARLGSDARSVYEYVAQQSQQRYALEWLQPLGFNNTYALLMRRQQQEQLGVRSISDIQALGQ